MPRCAAAPDAALARLLEELEVDVQLVAAKLDAFEALLRRWNTRYNLVSYRDAARLRERHVLDSLALLPWWAGTLADLGSGAGFPGVPLAIARPDAEVVLVERSERKGRFLRQVVIDLELRNVQLAIADASCYEPPTPFDTVVARALAKPAIAWRLARRLLAADGRALFQTYQPLAATTFANGAVRASQAAGVGWVTVVGVG